MRAWGCGCYSLSDAMVCTKGLDIGGGGIEWEEGSSSSSSCNDMVITPPPHAHMEAAGAPVPDEPGEHAAFQERVECWVCCEDSDAGTTLLASGCACRGTSGMAHLRCLVAAAMHDVARSVSPPQSV